MPTCKNVHFSFNLKLSRNRNKIEEALFMTNNQLLGIHHVTAITDDAARNYKFFTEILGMRLVKKTVNQDDIQTYHTFFADDVGSAGTDMTFFDFLGIPKGRKGTNSITKPSFRVPNDDALEYYLKRFDEYGVEHEGIQTLFGKKVLPFQEEDGQDYQLVSDEGNTGVAPGFKKLLEDIYGMKVVVSEDDVALLEVGEGGNGGQVILRRDSKSPNAFQGYGEVHHVSFRVKNHEAIEQWIKKYSEARIPNSGLVDRFYFEALYARLGHILLEISTDGPGFMGDEPYETLGEKLSLPPFLEEHRDYIETQVRPFDTTGKSYK